MIRVHLNFYIMGTIPGTNVDGVFSSLNFQRLYGSDFFESHVLRQNFGPETKVPGLFYCNGLSRQPWNSNDQDAFPGTYTDVVLTSLKSMKMGPVLGIRLINWV